MAKEGNMVREAEDVLCSLRKYLLESCEVRKSINTESTCLTDA